MTEHKFRVLLELKRKRIDEAQALKLLDTSERTLKQLLTLWSDNLGATVKLFDLLTLPTNSKREQSEIKERIAAQLEITKRQVNRLITSAGITVPPPKSSETRKIKRETARNRRKSREKHAIDVISGLNSVEEAAIAAEVSERHIYRLVQKLCSLVGLEYKDLNQLGYNRRQKVTKEIEKLTEDV